MCIIGFDRSADRGGGIADGVVEVGTIGKGRGANTSGVKGGAAHRRGVGRLFVNPRAAGETNAITGWGLTITGTGLEIGRTRAVLIKFFLIT